MQSADSIGMEFDEKGWLKITTQEAADFLMLVVDRARTLDEQKKPSFRPETFKYPLPYTLGPGATKGAISVLEKVAETTDKVINPDVVTRAGYIAVQLNESRGAEEDKGLLSRIASAARLRSSKSS